MVLAAGWQQYVATARWYAGKDREGTLTRVDPLGWYTLPGRVPAVRSELATVSYADGSQEAYHLLVGYLPAGTAEPEALIGRADLPGNPGLDVVDAPASPTAMRALFAAISGTPCPLLRWVERHPVPESARITLVPGEQSNSAVAVGDTWLKVYRRVLPGRHPEPEVLTALSGTDVTPRLYGVLASGVYDLAVLSERLVATTDGWTWATRACAAGTPLDADLRKLGAALRTLHQQLAASFGTGKGSGADLGRRMLSRLDAARAQAPVLEPYAAALTGIIAGVAGREFATQRVHGDFHLGQALLGPQGWRILDFEGEPGAPLAQRRGFDSPWRDVAGLLRSLDYVRSAHPDPDGREAEAWYQRARLAFLAGYTQGKAPDPALLRAYQVDRAAYEVAYESRNRPGWVRIPLAAVQDEATRDTGDPRRT